MSGRSGSATKCKRLTSATEARWKGAPAVKKLMMLDQVVAQLSKAANDQKGERRQWTDWM